MAPNTIPEYLKLDKPVAILVDGAFFLNRYRVVYPNGSTHTAQQIAKQMYTMLLSHLQGEKLYRILFYDCPPFMKKVQNPISKQPVDMSKTPTAIFRQEFHKELKKMRKVAIRLGYLKGFDWKIDPVKTRDLLNGKIQLSDLTENDVSYDIQQKGVDIKIGLDIASITQKKLVDRIILVSGDADFVPVAKHARREGVDFVLDPMWKHIDESLLEHVDGIKSYCPKPTYP